MPGGLLMMVPLFFPLTLLICLSPYFSILLLTLAVKSSWVRPLSLDIFLPLSGSLRAGTGERWITYPKPSTGGS